MWHIEDTAQTPNYLQAIYFFVLGESNEVRWSHKLAYTHYTHWGDLNSFTNTHAGAPLIPIDIHMALSLGWATPQALANNMPYLDEKIRAAIRLVT